MSTYSITSKDNGVLPNITSTDQLQALIREAVRNKDTEEVLEFIGENNGWSVVDLLDAPQDITSLELFLVSIPRIPELKFFPFLTVLKLQHIGLSSMADLKCLHFLEELWLSQNDITKIEGLEHMAKLRKLFLNSNRIASMDGLPVLKHLRELWLSQNEIKAISHLENIRRVRVLNLASNPISSLENVFGSYLASLYSLNLSGCRLYSFHHVSSLAVLPCLRILWFSDPLYGDNAICRLNNYTTFTLHVLSNLEVIDYTVITSEQRALADCIYTKKRVYYSMRIHTLKRNIGLLLQHAQVVAAEKIDKAREAKRHLSHHLHGIQNDLLERTIYNKSSVFEPETIFPTGKLEETKNILSHAVGTREVEIKNISKRLAEATRITFEMKQQLKQQLCVELNTGGNIRLDEVAKNDSWSESAQELVFARFKAESYRKYGIDGVEINRVFRVVNRGLRLRFDERVKELNVNLMSPHHRKSLLCLFSVVPVTQVGAEALLDHMMIHGMDAPMTMRKESALHSYVPSLSEGVPLTNSIFLADEERLQACLKSGQINGINANSNALSARLFVFRVFLGKSVTAIGGSTKDEKSTFLRGGKKVIRRDYGSDVFSVYRTLPEDTSLRAWYCFDRTLVLPELLIDFTYKPITPLTVAPALTLLQTPEIMKKYIDSIIPGTSRNDGNDIQNVSYHLVSFLKWCEPGVFDQFAKEEADKALQKGNSLLAMLTGGSQDENPSKSSSLACTFSRDVLVKYAAKLGVTDVKQLSFCGLRLKGFTAIPQDIANNVYPSVSVLDLSRNKIGQCSWFGVATAFPNLKHFNLSDNELTRLDLQSCVMGNVVTLDLSYNKLEDIDETEAIVASFPKIQRLTIHNNPMMSSKNAESIALLAFSGSDLTQLNDIDLFSTANLPIPYLLQKRTLDLRTSANGESSISLRYLLRMAYKDWAAETRPYDLLSLDSDVTPERYFEDAVRQMEEVELRKRTSTMVVAIHEAESEAEDGGNYEQFFSSLSTVQYTRSLLRSIEWVKWLPNLRHLIMKQHSLNDLSPVLSLIHLEILDVEGNCLTVLPDLSSLSYLRELNVSFNQIKHLNSMGALTQLRCFSANGNLLQTLDAEQFLLMEKLEELYLARNKFSNKAEFYAIKNLPQLITLDLFGNPMLSDCHNPKEVEELRFYFIYHFRRIKVFDSQPVSQSESQQARDVYAGKMNACLLTERSGQPRKQWDVVKDLDLSYCFLREISLLESFSSLEVLRLDHNSLARIDGISCSKTLKVLNLSHNKLGSCQAGLVGGALRHLSLLESLSLEANHLTELATLKLDLPKLKFLNLKNNELQSVEKGLGKLPELREIILVQNKIRGLGPECFSNCKYLCEVYADDNCIRGIEGVASLVNLEVLSLGANRLSEHNAVLSDIRSLPLTKLTLIGNPLARKSRYRQSFIAALSRLTTLDGKLISPEEREKAENAKAMEYVAPPNVVIDMSYSMPSVSNRIEKPFSSTDRNAHSLPSAQMRLHPMSGTLPSSAKPPSVPPRKSLNLTRGRDRF